MDLAWDRVGLVAVQADLARIAAAVVRQRVALVEHFPRQSAPIRSPKILAQVATRGILNYLFHCALLPIKAKE